MAKVTLQDRIKAIQPYFRGIEVKETLFILRIVYPNRWSAYNREDEIIKAAKSDDNLVENEWFYYADVNDVDLNEMFDLVEETVQTNEEMYQKIELMRVRMEELKELFQEESLEKLKTLQFTFGETVKPKKRTTRKKNKKNTEEVITPTEEVTPTEPKEEILTTEDLNDIERGWE